MRCFLCSVLIIYLSASVHPWVSDSLKLNIPNLGGLLGRYMESQSGRGIKAFLGIPFAEPPVGDLRFREPVPKRPWKTVLDATKGLKICAQLNWFDPSIAMEPIGVEDCLYLNIYVPHKYDSDGTEHLPVMLWYHGGGWKAGFNEDYGPEYLLNHDVILVTANYRLGALGFLSTGQEDCPGNNGFKDQVLALKWVKENIKYFGGDSSRITIFGESAGGASVAYHMISPLSKDLFLRGIAQSGATVTQWALPPNPGEVEKLAEKYGELSNCPKVGNDWKGMINCLRTKPVYDLTKSETQFIQWGMDPVIVFGPVVEYEHDGAFLTKNPRDEKHAWGNNIDLMTGLTLNEGALKAAPVFSETKYLEEFKRDYKKLLPIMLFYDHLEDSKKQELTDELFQYYFGGKFEENKLEEFTNLFTDGWFLSGLNEFLQIRFADKKSNKQAKTLVYLFAHRGDSSISEIFGGGSTYYGVCHADELMYLFPYLQEKFVSTIPRKETVEIRNAITKIWVEFATTGYEEKCHKCSGGPLPKWESAKSFPLNYLRIGLVDSTTDTELVKQEKGLLTERSIFWRKIVSKYFSNTFEKDEL